MICRQLAHRAVERTLRLHECARQPERPARLLFAWFHWMLAVERGDDPSELEAVYRRMLEG